MQLWEFIEYENENQLLVYKHPCQDFNSNTKLIVREGQTAIFLKNGKLADVFSPGRYPLQTENLPLLSKIMAIPTGGNSSFSAEVFFISTTNVMSMNWGTSSPVDLADPVYKIIVKVGASGQASFRITDALSFFRAFIGTKRELEEGALVQYFRSVINMHIKNGFSDAVIRKKLSVLDLNADLVSLAESAKAEINEKISRDGIRITYFSVENLMIPENDPSLRGLKEALTKKAQMDLLGYTYKEERSFDVMDALASREDSGGGIASTMMNAGIGLGIAGAVGNTVRSLAVPVQSATAPAVAPDTAAKECPQCKSHVPSSANFCPGCGYKFRKTRFCPSCGAEIGEAEKFCHECGAKQ